MKSLMLRKKRLVALMSLGITLLTSSCTNLTPLQEWSKTSLEALQLNELVATYSDTPHRLERYDPSQSQFYAEQTAERTIQAEALKKILAVVSDYLGTLTTLSADGTVDYTQQTEGLKSEISNLNSKLPEGKQISKNTLGAVGSIVKTVLGAATQAYQAKQVSHVIEQANAPIQQILKGELREIVDTDFRRDLKIESIQINGYYSHLGEEGHPSKAAQEAVSEWKEMRLEQNSARMKAVTAYLKVLDNISTGHQKLFDNRHKLDDKQLIKDLNALVIELRKQINILAKS
ncbi:MAG: hypothetical protein WCI01_09940 [Chlorobiaceae bacterium]